MYIYLNCRLRSFEHFQYSNHCFFSFAVINAKIQCTPAMKEIAVGLQYNLNGFQMPQIAAIHFHCAGTWETFSWNCLRSWWQALSRTCKGTGQRGQGLQVKCHDSSHIVTLRQRAGFPFEICPLRWNVLFLWRFWSKNIAVTQSIICFFNFSQLSH